MKRRDFLKNTITAAAALCGGTAVAAMSRQSIESDVDNIGTRTDHLDILRRFNDVLASLGNTLQQYKCGHLVPNDIIWDGDRCWIVENLIYIPNHLAFPDKVSYDPDLEYKVPNVYKNYLRPLGKALLHPETRLTEAITSPYRPNYPASTVLLTVGIPVSTITPEFNKVLKDYKEAREMMGKWDTIRGYVEKFLI